MYAQHPRTWRDFHYVYPVVSRRSKGLSIGINLNPDKACNFDCVYCCVNRAAPAPAVTKVDLDVLRAELDRMLDLVKSGGIWAEEPFSGVRGPHRRVNDIAFSGDGEPTTYRHFDKAVQLAAELKKQHGLTDVKLVLITNATVLERPLVQRGLALLDVNHGEVWAKLDAGTEAYYQQIDRTGVSLSKVLRNIRECGRIRPIVIQSLFLNYRGTPTPPGEFEAYLDRLRELQQRACRIKLVQLYTIARPTADKEAVSLTHVELDALVARFREQLPELRAEVYYGVG
jgi:wyosine [tRNA(Phe)-imidazoG37] synthetase (radical SAM superfamily)